MDKKYEEAISLLPQNIKSYLEQAGEELAETVFEICFRSNKPLMLMTSKGARFIDKDNRIHKNLPDFPLIIRKSNIEEILRHLTEYSLHSFKNEILSGYITIKGGHRAGVLGTAVYDKGKIISVNDISSINLRIARTMKNVALSLSRELFSDGLSSSLIVGCPASGKTTVLKDIARLVSENKLDIGYKKVSVIDERGEIGATYHGIAQNDIGFSSDVLDGYNKENGMEIAIRSMNPDLIILDEITKKEDAEAIRKSLNSGVKIIATVHAKDEAELSKKGHVRELIEEYDFQNIVFLKGGDKPSTVEKIMTAKELLSLWQEQ